MGENASAISFAKQARTIRLLACLQGGTAFNAKELSQRFKVSRRTIYRDLNLIRRAGIRIAFDNRTCGYRLEKEPEPLPVGLGLSVRDVAKLVLTSHLSVLCAVPQFRISVRESLARLMLTFPSSIREAVGTLLNCCEVDLPLPTYPAHTMDLVEQILEGMVRRRQLRLEMRWLPYPPLKPRRIQLAPYRLIADHHTWWLFGRSTQHQRIVRVCISDIRNITVSNQTYTLPAHLRTRSLPDDPRVLDLR